MTRIAIVALGLVLVAAAVAGRAEAASLSVNVDIGVFHDALSPYGDWVQTERFGAGWCPARVEHGWRPYTRGRWVFSDYGWTWVGDEEWGWATYHYGRWAFDPEYGWIWIPGSEWGPAWVAWRHGGGYVGWAPLPPEVGVDMAGVNFDVILDPFAFSFVDEHYLLERHLASHFVPVARNVTCVHLTRNITNYTVVDHRMVNRGVEIERIEKVTGRHVTRLQVRDFTSAEAPGRSRVRGAEVDFYRPQVGPARHDWQPTTQTRPVRGSGDTLIRRHDHEMNRLQAQETRERQTLRKTYEQEERTAPAGPSQAEIRRNHEAELQAQEQHEQRERQSLQARQKREQGGGPPAAKDKPRGRDKKR